MPALNNPKHERFARLIIQGMTQVDAFRKCYPNAGVNTVNNDSSVLAKRLDVKARIAEMQDIIDSYFPMTQGERRDKLRRMADGREPTKVVRKADGKIEAVYDKLAAMTLDARLAGDFAPEQMQIATGPTLKLDFNMVGRNTRPTPALEEEWRRLNEPEVRDVTEEPHEDASDDLSFYENAKVRPSNESLDDLKPIIDIDPEEITPR
jgi:hypothetical protein